MIYFLQMKKANLNKAIILGWNLHWMTTQSNNQSEILIKKINGRLDEGIGLIDGLELMKETLIEFNFTDTITINEIEKLINKLYSSNYLEYSVLQSDDKQTLNRLVNLWIDRVRNNARSIECYVLDDDYTLNRNKLLLGAKSFFEESIWNKMQDITKRDLEEALKCVLCKLPTSAGILSLRATEAELRQYYSRHLNKDISDNTNINWGGIISEFKKNNINQSLIGHLDYLRNNLRNKLSHPDSVLDQREAENIFSMIVTTITEMIKS